jgi:hypothetical protein
VRSRQALRWFVGAVAGSFAAGVGIWLALPVAVEAFAGAESDDPHAVYARDLAQRFDLTAEQQRLVQMVLESRDLEQQRILLRDMERLPAELQREVRDSFRRADERIKYVLTPEQRERFLAETDFESEGR